MVKAALMGATVLTMGVPAYTAANAQGATSGQGSDVIVVQARRRDEDVQDVPAVIQAVSGDKIEELEFRQFEDITALVPGLSLEGTLGGISGNATLRGVDFDGRAAGSNTSVEFYRNDAVIPSSGLFQALFDVEQIEVLRGPQGTLKGRASPSGSITVYTRKPDLREAGGFVSATYAEGDEYNINGAINVPIIEDKFGVRVAGLLRDNDGNGIRGLNPITGAIDNNISDHTEALRVSAQANPFDDVLILDFNYEGLGRDGRNYSQVQSFNQVVSTAGASPIAVSSKDNLGVGLLAGTSDQKVEIFNWQAKLNAWGQSLIYLGQDYKATTSVFAPQDFAGVLTNPVLNGVPFANDTVSLSEATVHEVRLQNEERLFGMFDYVVGYMNLKQNSPTNTTSLVSRAVTSVAEGAPFSDLALNIRIPIVRFRTAKEESFFGNITAHVTDRLELSAGLRHIEASQNSGVLANGSRLAAADDCRGFNDPGAVVCTPSSKKTIYTASASYDVTDDIMAYGSFGTSFRPGNVVVATVFNDIGPFLNQFIRPADETSKSFEAGVKTSWLNDTLQFNLTGFYQKFKNFAFRPGNQVLILDDVYAPTDVKGLVTFDGLVVPADAKIKGLEAELSWAPSDNFFLSSVLSYTDGKIKNAAFPCVDLNNDNIPDTGTPPTADQLYAEVGTNQVDTCLGDTNPGRAPKWAGSFLAEYSNEFSTGVEGFIRGLVDFKGDNDGVGVNPLDSVDAFALFDLFLGVRDPDGAWNVTLYGKNLFDTHRVLTRESGAATTAFRFSAAQSGTNYIGITTTQPQEFGITARLAFGSR